jgi:hypothetical protein
MDNLYRDDGLGMIVLKPARGKCEKPIREPIWKKA